MIKIAETVPTSSPNIFELENAGSFWPAGYYPIYLSVNGKGSQTIDFEVSPDYFSD